MQRRQNFWSFLRSLRSSSCQFISGLATLASVGVNSCGMISSGQEKDDDAPAHFVGSIVYVMSLISQSFEKQIDEIPRRPWHLLT
jgi:hypothetical protein